MKWRAGCKGNMVDQAAQMEWDGAHKIGAQAMNWNKCRNILQYKADRYNSLEINNLMKYQIVTGIVSEIMIGLIMSEAEASGR